MAIETERRFLVKDDGWQQEYIFNVFIRQGYLSTDPERIVRVRTQEYNAYLTVKGMKNNGSGLEYEYPIPYINAVDMLNMCTDVLEKRRYYVNRATQIISTNDVVLEHWEIDVFYGDNDGLIIAELEFNTEDTTILNLPYWIGEEVTDDQRYANSNLAKYPYNSWNTLFR